jgi:hypothetical protein
MTHVDRHTAHQARIQRVSDGVVASYINDIAAPAPRRQSRAAEGSAPRHGNSDARKPGSAVGVGA